MNWGKALDPAEGGPGESPGRSEAVLAALAATAEKARLREVMEVAKGKKRRRG